MRRLIKDGLSRKIKKRADGGAGQGDADSCSPATKHPIPTPVAAASGPERASPVTTITAHPLPEKIAPSPPQPSNLAPTSPASVPPSAQPAVSEAPSANDDIDPWTRAYEIFQEREPKLMADYKKHLKGNATTSADLSGQQWVKSVVNELLEERKEKQLQVPFLGHDIKIRTQVERLAKFFLWSDSFVKAAVSAQPYAALAWSGVSLLLPVGK